MQLKRLNIQSLPGIEPGFTFVPPGAGVSVVTGPNAIGKSSLERALGYLLRGARKGDPLALSLEAELDDGDSAWQVQRNGSQVSWRRDGDPVAPPVLPGSEQAGLYRLSVEHLLAGDDRDSDFARRLRHSLHGGFDLDAPRLDQSTRFGQTEANKLSEAQQALRQAEAEYDALARQEDEELPRLEREIRAAGEAQNRLQPLQLGLEMHQAIAEKKSCAEALKAYPADMDKLRGDEQARLASLEEKSGALEQKLREQQRALQRAEAALEETGLQQSGPDPEKLDAMEARLQQLGQKLERRNNARDALSQADAGLKKALESFGDSGARPSLDEQSLGRAEAIAVPLIKAQFKRDQLAQKLEQAGNPPDEAEINQLFEAGISLREWLAASAAESGAQSAATGNRARIAFRLILVASAGFAVLLALLQPVWWIAFAAFTVPGVAAWGLFSLRQRPGNGTSADQAKQRFTETGLAPPPGWTDASVREYLRAHVDKRHSELVLQRESAAQAGSIHPELEQAEADVEELLARKQTLAAELGFDPDAPSVRPELFMQYCRQLLEAETRHAQAQAGLEEAERDIATDVALVREFLEPWRSFDAPAPEDAGDEHDIGLLRAAFQRLERRAQHASDARKDISRCRNDIQASRQDITANQGDINTLFSGCGLEPDSHNELEQRLGLLDDWQGKREALQKAEFAEEGIRTRLEAHPDIIEQVEAGKAAALQSSFDSAEAQAGAQGDLLEQRSAITTRLQDAGKDHKLSQARAALDKAEAALHDKREAAWLIETTDLLLDEVEQTYQSEHVPPTLRRAQDLFRDITHGAFGLQLDKDGSFSARDLRQNAPRALHELSSGTRMQLLLALRLAWIEAQEQGGETLPLFLDEALTTSDEDRFKVMAASLERLAAAEGRQIFYLSARRHELALWKQATGNEPPSADLALVRFPEAARPPQAYDIALPPSLPSPEGREPEDYASILGVPLLNPRLEPGTAHLFHLLRDDLDLLHQLMDTWRITSLGQLESLLSSDAAPVAVSDAARRNRLRQRCGVVRTWTGIWRRGRGRPVDRIALEQSDIVSDKFIDRVTDLAESVDEDGKALVQALRAGQVSRFHTSKIDDLERWLAEQGYTEQEEILSEEERRRLTLQQAMSTESADTEDVNRVITWLESASC